MLPILSSIIVGQGERGHARRAASRWRPPTRWAWRCVYTALGVAAGLLGEGLAGVPAEARRCWSSFGVLLVVLSLSMFGFYELQLPSRAARPPAPATRPLSRRPARRRVRHGRALGADRQPLRRRRRWCGALLSTSARPARRRAGRRRAVLDRGGHERAAAGRRRLRRHAAAAQPARGWNRSSTCSACCCWRVAIYIVQPVLPRARGDGRAGACC